MLKELHLRDVGPAEAFDVVFAERLNVFTGDNGLGKTFLLDMAWTVLTQNFREQPLPRLPHRDGTSKPLIDGIVSGSKISLENWQLTITFNRKTQIWSGGGSNETESLLIYPDVAGGCLIHDSTRGFASNDDKLLLYKIRQKQSDVFAEPPQLNSSIYFTRENIWNGLTSGKFVSSNGLIQDWNRWQLQNNLSSDSTFRNFEKVLSILAHPDEPLKPGPPTRISINDVREIPTIQTSYGGVSITHASAGVKRILSLAYLLVWTWTEHVRNCEILGRQPTNQLVLILDEAELHLHPRWQRSIIPALLEVAKVLSDKIETQLIFTTHSPLVLASIEPEFDVDRDKLFLFDVHKGEVELNEVPWTKQGDAANWLTSPIFGLSQARSKEAEAAIEAAEAFMRGDRAALRDDLETKEQIHAELTRVLAGHDPFWPRWIVKYEGAA